MAYEPSTAECRVLIRSKEQIETMLLELSKLDGTDVLLQQLRQVHNQLEALHDLRRASRPILRKNVHITLQACRLLQKRLIHGRLLDRNRRHHRGDGRPHGCRCFRLDAAV